jgi:hypothetical protein
MADDHEQVAVPQRLMRRPVKPLITAEAMLGK